jgi:hypothetical protein
MSQEHQETLDETETVVGTLSDGTRLIKCEDGSGSVIEEYEDADFGTVHERSDYDAFRDAILHFAIILANDGVPPRPERGGYAMVPTSIVALGKPYVAAWIYTNGCAGLTGSRQVVADKLNISEQTVSNYLNRVRCDVTDA